MLTRVVSAAAGPGDTVMLSGRPYICLLRLPVIGLLMFVALFWGAVGCYLSSQRMRRDNPRYQTPPPRRRSTGAGRAVLQTMRTVNDVRALSRGPGAYGRRLARRAVFRSIRRL